MRAEDLTPNLEPELTEELRSLATELAGLQPRRDRLDLERLLFETGRASVAPPRAGGPLRAWQTAFAAMTVLAASLLMALLVRPEPQIVERIVRVPVPSGNTDKSVARPDPSDRAPGDSGLGGQPAAAQESDLRPRLVSVPSGSVGLLSGLLFGTPDRRERQIRTAYSRMLDEALGEVPESRTESNSAPRNEDPPTTGPASYRELRDSLLEDMLG